MKIKPSQASVRKVAIATQVGEKRLELELVFEYPASADVAAEVAAFALGRLNEEPAKAPSS